MGAVRLKRTRQLHDLHALGLVVVPDKEHAGLLQIRHVLGVDLMRVPQTQRGQPLKTGIKDRARVATRNVHGSARQSGPDSMRI